MLKRMVIKNPGGIKNSIKAKIHAFLHFYRIEKYEISFIHRYRLHLLKPELESEQDLIDLWAWDKE